MPNVNDIIGSFAASLNLPAAEQSTIDRVIELLASNAAWSKYGKDDLLEVIANKQYNGGSPAVMFLLCDVIGGKSNKALYYGIQAFEASERDPKKLVALENPEGLVDYVINSAESLDDWLS